MGAGVGRSSSGFRLFASLSGECKMVGNGKGLIAIGPGLERGFFSQTSQFATGSQVVN